MQKPEAAFYALDFNLPDAFPKSSNILHCFTNQEFYQHVKETLPRYWSQAREEVLIAICTVAWRFILHKKYTATLKGKAYSPWQHSKKKILRSVVKIL
jgi:hypothetical protein